MDYFHTITLTNTVENETLLQKKLELNNNMLN